jgi:hypothetical protein
MDSVDGLHIAQLLGISSRYASQLRTQLSQVWLLQSSPGQQGGGENASLVELSRMLGLQPGKLAPTTRDIAAAVAAQGSGGLSTLLAAWLLGSKDNGAHASGSTVSAQGSIFTAADDNLKFLITGDTHFRAQARAIVNALSSRHGLYTDGATPSSNQPSVVATALADWILHVPVPGQALKAAGLCNPLMSCGMLGTISAIDEPLRSTAAVMIGRSANYSFPIGI